MQTIPLNIENGRLIFPKDFKLPIEASKAVLVIDDDLHPNDDIDSIEFMQAVLSNPAYDFLYDEPDIYSDADILPGKEHPHFIGRKNGLRPG